MSNNAFRKFVIIFVTLIGAGFGTWAGFLYFPYVWIATILGIISGYVLSRVYLAILTKIAAKGYGKLKVALAGAITGALCGLLSTVFIHGIMILLNNIAKWEDFAKGEGGIELFIAVLIGCHVVGTLVGLIAGGLCSQFYILRVMKHD